jgi:hypothetical protein
MKLDWLGPDLPADRGEQVERAGPQDGRQQDPHQDEGAQREPRQPGHHGVRRADQDRHPLARAVARGARGGQQALLRGEASLYLRVGLFYTVVLLRDILQRIGNCLLVLKENFGKN